jgi:hypothetical protein
VLVLVDQREPRVGQRAGAQVPRSDRVGVEVDRQQLNADQQPSIGEIAGRQVAAGGGAAWALPASAPIAVAPSSRAALPRALEDSSWDLVRELSTPRTLT